MSSIDPQQTILLGASSAFSALLLAACAAFLSLYETSRPMLHKTVLSRYLIGFRTSLVALFASLLATVFSLLGVLWDGWPEWPSIVAFVVTIASAAATGVAMWHATR